MKRFTLISCLLLTAAPAFAADAPHDSCDRSAHEQDVSHQRVMLDEHGPSRGPANAKVTVVVFSDYECPFCQKSEQTLAALRAKYGKQLRIVFKNRPLPRHTHAKLAAVAALAAGEQGKYWEFHDWLYSGAATLTPEGLTAEAQRLGLDTRRFQSDLQSTRFDAQLAADMSEADRLQVEGTPTFFVNGLRVIGAQPLETFEGLIDGELGR